MPAHITPPFAIRVQNAGGAIVVASASTLRFSGAVVSDLGNGIASIAITGGGPITPGDPGTFAVFDTSTSQLVSNFHFSATNGVAFGNKSSGTVIVTGAGGFVFGNATTRPILVSGVGSFAFGSLTGGSITTSGDGSACFGVATAPGADMTTDGVGSLCFGYNQTGHAFFNGGDGSLLHAATSGLGADISIGGSVKGAHASGSVASPLASSSIQVNGDGSSARFSIECDNASVVISGKGSSAVVRTSVDASTLTIGGDGSHFSGILGGLTGAAGNLTISGIGTHVFGTFAITGHIFGLNSIFSGLSNTDAIGADQSQTFGEGLVTQTSHCLHHGSFGTTSNAGDQTDPAYQMSNGSDRFTPNIGYMLSKDGRIYTIAAQVNIAVRQIATTDTISARGDRTILCDLSAAGGNVNLPPGENGLEFSFGVFSTGAGAYVLVPDGSDTLDAQLSPNITSPLKIVYLSGVWYSIG